jgi:hypothetical protein
MNQEDSAVPVADDPLVPLLSGRLEAARKVAGLSIRDLADKVDLRYQWVDEMRRAKPLGKGRSCKRSNRYRLAEALGLPRTLGSLWLGGEAELEFPWIMRFEQSSMKVQLARLRLLERCLEAWTRDAANGVQSHVDSKSVIVAQRSQLNRLQEALIQLTAPIWWRGQLIEHEEPVVEIELAEDSPALAPDEHAEILRTAGAVLGKKPVAPDAKAQERIEEALIIAVETILQPWLEGTARLNYKNFLGIGNRYWWEPLRGG